MILRSRFFEQIEVDEKSVLYLPDGLLGFEDLKHYILAEVEEFRPFLWLVSVDDPEIGFAISDPQLFFGRPYEVGLSDADKDVLELQTGDEISVFVIVSIWDGGRKITADLKGPVVLNTRNRLTKQVVIYNPAYSVRQPLLTVQEGGAREAALSTARDRMAAQG
jgi:flagellar assembly factor FliW